MKPYRMGAVEIFEVCNKGYSYNEQRCRQLLDYAANLELELDSARLENLELHRVVMALKASNAANDI